jgi:membrane-associated phospholipid phosphatase
MLFWWLAPYDYSQGARILTYARRLLASMTARSSILFGAAALSTVVFAQIADVVIDRHADAFDLKVAVALRQWDRSSLDLVMRLATYAGSWFVVVPVCVVVTLVAIRRRHWEEAAVLLTASVVTITVSGLLKAFVARARPTLFHELPNPTSYSFPSGHAVTSVAVYGTVAAVLVALFPKRRGFIVSGAIIAIFMIGFSRVYLGVHWPSDVLGGYVLGIPILAAAIYSLPRRARIVVGTSSETSVHGIE